MSELSIPGLAEFKSKSPELYRAFKALEDSHNNVAMQVNADPTSEIPPPQPHSAISVKGGAGVYDIQLTDNSPQYRGKSNFTEYSPDQKNWHVIDMGASRNHRAYLGKGPLHFRSYTAHDTSDRSDMIYHAPVSAGGNTEPEMQASRGSGTSSDPGAGFGPMYNTANPPKR